MTLVQFHPAAQQELQEAFEWYQHHAGPRIAGHFLDEVEEALSLLKNHPEIGESGCSHTRRLIFQRYPYTLVYRLKGETLEIIAIAHHRRRPTYWAGRR
jgi:toxin ParE1/3/4